MWKYIPTDEMFVKNESELYHSNVYLGKDFSDSIKHWKYIKREKKNGRWVYYYNDPEKAWKNYQNDRAIAYDNYDKAYRERQNYANKLVRGEVKWDDKKIDKLLKNERDARNKFHDDKTAWKKYINEEKNGTLYLHDAYSDKKKIRKKMYKSFAKILDKSSSAIHKGKRTLSKIFGK